MNFGLLSICNNLSKNGFSVFIHDQTCTDIDDVLNEILKCKTTPLICVSIISAYNAESANKILEKVKLINKQIITIIGGQHYVGLLGQEAMALFPEADILISGEGENALLAVAKEWSTKGDDLYSWDINKIPANVLLKIGNMFKSGKEKYSIIDLNDLENIDYSSYPNLSYIFPSIEFSRGCKHACSFCANTNLNRKYYRKRNPHTLKESIKNLLAIYSIRPLRFYFQTSDFHLDSTDIEIFVKTLEEFSNDIQWRTELRIDRIHPAYFDILFKVGMRIVDIGLDTASQSLIRLTRKASNGLVYLQRAEQMLKHAKDAGIFTKVNFLIQPGESQQTIAESEFWLSKNARNISAVSVSPTLLFPGTELMRNFEFYRDKFGTEKVETTLSKWGVYEISPSNEIPLEKAKTIALQLSQKFNTRTNYAYSKSFGYYGNEMTLSRILTYLPFQKKSPLVPYHDD